IEFQRERMALDPVEHDFAPDLEIRLLRGNGRSRQRNNQQSHRGANHERAGALRLWLAILTGVHFVGNTIFQSLFMSTTVHPFAFASSRPLSKRPTLDTRSSGCPAQSVPSLSNTAMRSAGSTKSGEPFFVTFATKSRIDFRAAPVFHDGSGSVVCSTPL